MSSFSALSRVRRHATNKCPVPVPGGLSGGSICTINRAAHAGMDGVLETGVEW